MTLRGPRVVAAELALLGVSLSVVYGFGRLFSDSSWAVPLTLTAVGTHAISATVRRMRLGVGLQIVVAALGLLLLLGWTIAPETLRWGLPTATTLEVLGDAVDTATTEYPQARAPVEPVDGFVLLSMVGVALVALMANIAAFTLRAPLQALVPPFTLFALCSILGSGEQRIGTTLAFLVTSLSFMLCVRGIDASTATTWLPGDDRRGPDALMRLGGALIATSAVAAFVVGPALPGAADEGLWTWRGGGGIDRRIVPSPLVSIQERLVNQSRQVAFTVESPESSYWRLMALDEFDGENWTVRSNFRQVAGSIGMVVQGAEDRTIETQIEIQALESEYLPAAFEPTFIDAGDEAVGWDDRSSTLLLDRRAGDGFEYTARSILPTFTADELRAADGPAPLSVRTRYLQLPDLDPRVAELAASVTAAAPTQYDRALALQTFFRDEFEYSLDIPEGSDEEAIIRFLFEDRQGYCEQFAATYAAMARSLGLPARVAVGFTEGERSRANPEFFTVRGQDAHAWPEVYFDGLGWVPFEPTPGRVPPGGQGWTTLEDEPDSPEEDTTPTTQPTDATLPTIPPDLEGMFPDEGGSSGGGVVQDDASGPPTILVWAAGIVAAALLWTAAVRGLVVARQARRRRRVADDPSARVGVAWTEVVEALAHRGRVPRESETYLEYAARVGPTAPTTAGPLRELAELATEARFSGGPVSAEQRDRAAELAHTIVRSTIARMPWWRRALHLADPRVLLPARARRSRQRATVLAPT